jgi:glycogen(starch) synthase
VPGDGTVGIRLPASDAAALSAVIERTLRDDAGRERLVAQAREHVLRFDWTEVARRTLALYAQLAPPVTSAPGVTAARAGDAQTIADRLPAKQTTRPAVVIW